MIKRKRRIELLEERVSELEVLLEEQDELLDRLRGILETGRSEARGITTAQLLDEWQNGEEAGK